MMPHSMPWSSKPPALRRRDANARNYELRMSKSSDSITAAKLLAEARMRQQQGKAPGGGLRINQDMSKSMEKQIDVYTKTRDDIRKILQVTRSFVRFCPEMQLVRISTDSGSNTLQLVHIA